MKKMSILRIIKVSLATYKKTILIIFLYLLFAKLATLAIPFTIKEIVDYFSMSSRSQGVLSIPMILISAYSLLYIGAAVFNELKEYL